MAHADASSLKETLETLQDVLPLVPEKLKTLLVEEAALKEAAEEFFQSLEERQAEATELFARVEAALAGMRRQATEQALLLQQYPDFEAVLDEDKLDFEEKLYLFLLLYMKKQQAVIEAKRESMERMVGFGSQKHAAFATLRNGMGRGEGRVRSASDVALRGAGELQNTVEASRYAVTDEVERLGAETDSHRMSSSRDVDQMRRDVEGFDAFFVDRMELVGNLVRRDTDRIATETRNRMADLRYLVSNAVEGVQEALDELDRQMRDAIEESAEARNNLAPLFENIEKSIGPLKEAIESVREAAHTVGIPF